jgi:hypothetical protein
MNKRFIRSILNLAQPKMVSVAPASTVFRKREKDGNPAKQVQVTQRFISIPMDTEAKAVQACISFGVKHGFIKKNVEELTTKDIKKSEAPIIERRPFARTPFANPNLISEILGMNLPDDKEDSKAEEKPSKRSKKG